MASTSPSSSLQFKNPIISGFNPDPSIARVGEDYFLTTSTFEYFPGLPIYHSRDLIKWNLIGHALTRRSQLDLRTVEPGGGIWAPTLRWRQDAGGQNGRFYLATCMWSRYRPKTDERIFPRGFYVYTDNIWDENAWSEPVYFDNPGFDQDLFWDDDGKVYLSTTVRIADRPLNSKLKDFAIHLSEIELETGRTLTAPVVIRSSPHGLAEGSHIIKRGKFYYLFTAEGGTEAGHQEWVMRSENGPYGPWTLGPRNPLWYNGPHEEVQSTGHADVFEDAKSNWWAVLLGTRPPDVAAGSQTQLGRESYLVKVDWEDDWPIFNDAKNIELLTASHDMKVQVAQPQLWTADFSQKELEIGWYTKHTPLKSCYRLQDTHLHLYGNCHNLSSPESPAMLLRKQTSFSQTLTVKLHPRESRPNHEAGIVLWWSQYSYISISATLMTHNTISITITKTASSSKTTTTTSLPVNRAPTTNPETTTPTITLIIKATPSNYSFHYNLGTKDKQLLTLPMTEVVRDPDVGGAFAGMMWGIYACGNGEPCLEPVVFSSVSVRND